MMNWNFGINIRAHVFLQPPLEVEQGKQFLQLYGYNLVI
jgi:hypothetical protein